MGDWLQVQLARKLGLNMGFKFFQPQAFLKTHCFTGDLGDDFAKGQAFWTPDHLRWILLPEVDRLAAHLGLENGVRLASRDRFAFAGLLAQQFDRYAKHRPDWPKYWGANKSPWQSADRTLGLSRSAISDESWQRNLWHSIVARPESPAHPACILSKLIEDPASLPSKQSPPIFVVGTDHLDPLFLRTLVALANQGQQIELHLLLPTLGYLGDVKRRKPSNDLFKNTNPEAASDSATHPLLASLGQQAVGTFALLDSITSDYSEWPDNRTESHDLDAKVTLLHRLQNNIRKQEPLASTLSDKEALNSLPQIQADDISLRIHCCHSPRRELEVLRDELLRAFEELPDLLPEEILVAVTDFDAYAPLAEAILRSASCTLPVRLTAIPAREANPVAVALLALLRLSLGRHTASDIIDLLNLDAIQDHLDLAEEPAVLAQLAEFIRNSGLTHGLNSSDRATTDSTGTWRFALDRQLAGSWLGPVPAVQDGEGAFVHPLASDLNNNDADVLKFANWLTLFADHLNTWRDPVAAQGWAERLEQTVDELLQCEANDDHAAALRRLIKELAVVKADTPLDAGTILDWLEPQLDNANSRRTSMGGEILFGRLDQIHGLPCRVLAILGLQDGIFPRSSRRPAWDLLAHRPEQFDTNPRTQDRQWFLDGILATKDRLILGAANRSLRTPHDGPLSSCVEELVRVAAATVRPANQWKTLAEQLVVSHRIQPFSPEYFTTTSTLPRSYDVDAARIGSGITQATAKNPSAFFTGAIGVSNPDSFQEITIDQLTAFWANPAQAWLKSMQLEASDEQKDDTILDDAPLTLNSLQVYNVRATALSNLLAKTASANAPASSRLAADRKLPPGALGDLAWDLHEREIAPLANAISPLLSKAVRTEVVCTPATNVRLNGELLLHSDSETTSSILVYRPSKLETPKYQLEAFIKTIVATVHLERPVACRIFGLDEPPGKELPAIALQDAQRLIALLISGYRLGQIQPLTFAPSCSQKLGNALADGKTEEVALDEAKASWIREPFNHIPGGEGLSPAAALAWRDADPFSRNHRDQWVRWAKAVSEPAGIWWTNQ